MTPIEGMPVLTAARMREAEARVVEGGGDLAAMMERAGQGVAVAVQRLATGAEALILCGPGNNGGDGWIAAAELAASGHPVRVAALGEPATDLARAARARWTGPVERLDTATPAPVLVDALFGTGARPLDDGVARALAACQRDARLRVAVDLPSHVDADTGAVAGAEHVRPAHVTLALGAVKPGHVLEPGAEYCGEVRVLDIGVAAALPAIRVAEPPAFLLPRTGDHKFSRGLAIIVGGVMPGAARLSATAAAHAGAGYVVLLADAVSDSLPHAVVQRGWSPEALSHLLAGKRNNVVVIGPGLGRDEAARARLAAAIACGERLIVDGDALHLLDEGAFAGFRGRDEHNPVVLTPHEGEFTALFGDWHGSKIDAALNAAERSGATVVFKGPDTVVATPAGEARIVRTGSRWLSTAGTGDVLTGAIAGAVLNIAVGDDAAAGAWMHAEAARRLGGAFVADDLARELGTVRARL